MKTTKAIDAEMRELIANRSAASVAKMIGMNRVTVWQYFSFWGEVKVPFSFVVKLEDAGLIDPSRRL